MNRLKLIFFTNVSLFHRRWASKSVRIGCASGFWGDTATAVQPLVQNGKLDFLVFDYLSEITMSLLARARAKSPDMGYTPDFVSFAMAPNLSEIKKQGIKVISNAGGINPQGCASALQNVAQNLGLDFKIAVVSGDDLMPQKSALEKMGIKEMKSGAEFPKHVHSMNAYLGAGPIAKALANGADIVITGRCVDSALALGPLMNTFGWKFNEWDKLASGSLAGHLIECGAQATGGIHTDWHSVPDWHKIGFPIAECYEDGSFHLSKPPHTGGIVTVGTATEQLLYEIGDPFTYLLPDVTCDFTDVEISQTDSDVVLIKGAKGRRPSNFYKVSATFSDGFRATAVCPVIGPRATQKALKTAESVLKRTEMIFDHLGMSKFCRTNVEILGAGHNYGKNLKQNQEDAREVVMWVAVHHDTKEGVALFAREIAAAATGAAPGLTTLVGGRPKPSPILKLFSFLYPKDKIKIEIACGDEKEEYVNPMFEGETSDVTGTSQRATKQGTVLSGPHSYRLGELAYTRSGDKGDTCNIGVIARHPSFVPYIEKQLTAAAVSNYFEHVFENPNKENVKRYFLPGVHAFNFVMDNALGGGGVASLKSDPQGKGCGQVLSDFVLQNMPSLEDIKKA